MTAPKKRILWSVYEKRYLVAALPWGLVRDLYGQVRDGSVIAVRRDRWGRLEAKDPLVGELFSYRDMEAAKVWNLPNLP